MAKFIDIGTKSIPIGLITQIDDIEGSNYFEEGIQMKSKIYVKSGTTYFSTYTKDELTYKMNQLSLGKNENPLDVINDMLYSPKGFLEITYEDKDPKDVLKSRYITVLIRIDTITNIDASDNKILHLGTTSGGFYNIIESYDVILDRLKGASK